MSHILFEGLVLNWITKHPNIKIRPIDDGNSNFEIVYVKYGYPHCKIHGAMNKVSPGPEGLWRCLTTSETECRAGAKQVKE